MICFRYNDQHKNDRVRCAWRRYDLLIVRSSCIMVLVTVGAPPSCRTSDTIARLVAVVRSSCILPGVIVRASHDLSPCMYMGGRVLFGRQRNRHKNIRRLSRNRNVNTRRFSRNRNPNAHRLFAHIAHRVSRNRNPNAHRLSAHIAHRPSRNRNPNAHRFSANTIDHDQFNKNSTYCHE